MLMYQLVFGVDQGQVHCVFHDDSRASAGIGPNGEYNCFTCGAKAHDEVGFTAKYFGVGMPRAATIIQSLERLQTYTPATKPLNADQLRYLHAIGLVDPIINKYFFADAVGKLKYRHTWNGANVGYTWFNSPLLANHNAGAEKYKYDGNNIAGSLTPYDDVIKYNTLMLCEGEKDMLTAKSFGIPNAVAKIGGAKSFVIGGVNVQGKKIIICYDCDDAGREGALKDAAILAGRFGCHVKILELGLGYGEDLNDYLVKYGHSVNELTALITATVEYVYVPEPDLTKVQKILASLTAEEAAELSKLLKGNNT